MNELTKYNTLDDWAAQGREIRNRAEQITWDMADWALVGEKKFNRLKEFCDAHGMNYASTRAAAKVAEAFPPIRRVQLAFAYHLEVAALPAKSAERWLGVAIEDKLTVPDLRARIRADAGEQSALESDGKPIKLPTKLGMDLCEWLTQQPPDFWTPSTKAFWKQQLKPLVEFYSQL